MFEQFIIWYALIHFDTLNPWKHHHDQVQAHVCHSHVCHSRNFSCAPLSTLLLALLPTITRQPLICFLLLYISLHFLEFSIDRIMRYVFFLHGFIHLAFSFFNFLFITDFEQFNCDVPGCIFLPTRGFLNFLGLWFSSSLQICWSLLPEIFSCPYSPSYSRTLTMY